MRVHWLAAAAAIVHGASSVTAKPARRDHTTHAYYALEHAPHAGAALSECAAALGVELVERVGELSNVWLVRAPHAALAARSASADPDADPVVAALAELRARAAQQPSWLALPHPRRRAQHARRVAASVRFLERQVPRQRVKRDGRAVLDAPTDGGPLATTHDVATTLGIADPEFPKQWHLVNDEFPEHAMNVSRLWAEGVTGKGIISALVDDGLDFTSDDLAPNFDAVGSYDYNNHIELPKPTEPEDHHGTRCAGQIAAAKNDACGVGIAYESKVAGIRILSGPISDIDEAAALNFGFQNTSIYSCSWGPTDDGRSMEAPGYLVEQAVVNGITNGRGGKGSVFVFASGNGAMYQDQCNFDGYTNSIYSITVAAVDYKGLHPPYSEACAANLVVAYSSGSGKHITTTDVGKRDCSFSHGGTSAAAPNAVGVFALALSVRPDLTWRDMQHLAVRSAHVINPDDPDWERTAQGRLFSYKYGFGAVDAYAYVAAARAWKSVKPQAWLAVPAVQLEGGTMSLLDEMTGGTHITHEGVSSTTAVTQAMMADANLETLEHVTVKVWIKHERRGDVEIELVSPGGVRSVLAGQRPRDAAKTGFRGWRFMSVKHWDENPVGNWTIRVNDQGNEHSGDFLGWTLSLWGSSVDPAKAKAFVVPKLDSVFPPLHPDEAENHPVASKSIAEAATSAKTKNKPTAALPTDHGLAEGEAHKPAFPGASASATSASAPASATPTALEPTADEGWFPDMASLSGDRRWLGVALALVLLFLAGAGAFFWRRRIAARRRVQYAALGGAGGDDLPMRARGGTKELYDAFGAVSDDDEDADEETGLRPRAGGSGGPLGAQHDVGYHSGFLDDDEPASPGRAYRDDEPAEHAVEGLAPHGRGGSGSGSDGSWEHASQTR